MKESFYGKLQDDFIMIRFAQCTNGYDREKYDAAILSVKEARKKIDMHSPRGEKEILLYCIDTLFEILSEGDEQKIFDFADAVHNVPEIYMQKRDLYSFQREFRSFQKKYGKHYFAFINEIKPRFTKRAPKNKWEYFSAESDDDFKKLHPIGYGFLVVCGMIAFLSPMIIYFIHILCLSPHNEPTSAVELAIFVLGTVGSLVMGIGLFNIVAAWIHQYLGHRLTAVCLSVGLLLISISLFLLCA